jgi:predicted phosphodiesterase
VKILSVSDKIIPALADTPENFPELQGVELMLGCGDLPYYYQENIAKKLRVPLYFVRGNHDSLIEYGVDGERKAPRNGIDLHRKTRCRKTGSFSQASKAAIVTIAITGIFNILHRKCGSMFSISSPNFY